MGNNICSFVTTESDVNQMISSNRRKFRKKRRKHNDNVIIVSYSEDVTYTTVDNDTLVYG
jgi:hypothetical protein